MATFNPKIRPWRRLNLPFSLSAGFRSVANGSVLPGWVAVSTLCTVIAALLPGSSALWSLAFLLILAGYVWLGVGLTAGGAPFGRGHLTVWDGALLSFATSFGVQAAAHLGA